MICQKRMRMSRKLIMIVCFFASAAISANSLDTLKGIWTSVEKIPEMFGGFFKGLGQSFGGSPSGYVYSFDVYNDMNQPVYVAVNEIMSFMGGDLPKPHGFSITVVEPFKHYQKMREGYYFELLIKSTDSHYSSNMPYLMHDDILYRHEAIQLTSAAHSQKIHYYRAFMGKVLKNGQYVHEAQAESLGYDNKNLKEAKTDPGTIKLTETLSSLTIYNSTDQDYYIGFSNQSGTATLSKTSCASYNILEKQSFGLLSTFGDLTTLTSGTIGVFDAKTNALLLSYNMPEQVFVNMPYTLEIYQDQVPVTSGSAPAALSVAMQGLTPGNYDQPMGRVKDLTPVSCVFWYQSAAQQGQSGYIDLPGKLWVVSIDHASTVLTSAVAGQAVAWTLNRPNAGQKTWIYFVYVATSNDKKAQQFIDGFMHQPWGAKMIQKYQNQALQQMQFAQNVAAQGSVPAAESMLVQAAQGILSLKGGAMIDAASGVTGYLLGGDVFLSNGVGPGPMYYQLAPSGQNSANIALPQQTVQNLYASSAGSTTAPSGMPAVTK
jgi:hypothetical protein